MNADPAARDAITHLTPARWATANRRLVAKALAEFSHERLLHPKELGSGEYAVSADDGTVEYRYHAARRALDHWDVAADTIVRLRDGVPAPPDALDLVLELRGTLGLTDQVLPVYLEEVTSTLASTAYKLTRDVPVAELAAALLTGGTNGTSGANGASGTEAVGGFQAVEAAMTEGHPCFVANNGRLGFDSGEYQRYAPEAHRPVRLVWVAAHRTHATFTSCADLSYEALLDAELAAGTRHRFAAALTGQGHDPADYLLIPVHPWQWWNRLSVTFAGEIAHGRLVYLGTGDDEYQAQQSIRTFFNLSRPGRHYVKTALSVLNMGFIRGLSAEYMAATPAINDWLAALLDGDPFLRRTGVAILRERAAVGYRHGQFLAATRTGSPYRKMLAALWRESPVGLLRDGERPVTMAALLHVDAAGRSLAAALIARSGVDPLTWVRRYLAAYLTPLLHCFYAYELVFMPHGENVILVLDRAGVPARVLLKDLAEEIGVMSAELPLPPEAERIRAIVPEQLKTLSLFTDVFDSFLRFLGAVLARSGILPEAEFWGAVAGCVRDYQASMPEFTDRFATQDLFVEEFPRSCLNRLQLRDNQQMVDLTDPDPAGGLQVAGTLRNPIATP